MSADGLADEYPRIIFEIYVLYIYIYSKVTMNLPLCNLFGIECDQSGIAEINFDKNGKYGTQNNMTYFKAASFAMTETYKFRQKKTYLEIIYHISYIFLF